MKIKTAFLQWRLILTVNSWTSPLPPKRHIWNTRYIYTPNFTPIDQFELKIHVKREREWRNSKKTKDFGTTKMWIWNELRSANSQKKHQALLNLLTWFWEEIYRVFHLDSTPFISQVEQHKLDSSSMVCLHKTLRGLCYRHFNF